MAVSTSYVGGTLASAFDASGGCRLPRLRRVLDPGARPVSTPQSAMLELARLAGGSWAGDLTLGTPLDREIVYGFMHLLYHIAQAPNIYAPSRSDRGTRCKFCPKEVVDDVEPSE